MKTIVEVAINSGNYQLSDMLGKIDSLWVRGKLTDEEREALESLARAKASAEDEYAPITERLTALELRVLALEGGTSSGGEAESDNWPEWIQPTGAHDVYQIGTQVIFEGVKYVSLIDGNVWSPTDYPEGWQAFEVVVEDTTEDVAE